MTNSQSSAQVAQDSFLRCRINAAFQGGRNAAFMRQMAGPKDFVVRPRAGTPDGFN
jgi:hypothetical protein